MNMKDKKILASTLLTFMVACDVQNTEGDYEKCKEFTEKMVFAHADTFDDLYDTDSIAADTLALINPLWDYYMSNLHDGYNVTVGGKDNEK